MHKHRRWTTRELDVRIGANLTIAVASLVGIAAFVYPFLLPVLEPAAENRVRASEAPLLFALITVLCLLAIVFEVQPGAGGQALQHAAKTAALLGVLVAVDATLRLAPTFLGASPIFPLILITGAVFGSATGFQMGALTLLVSAFITGGIGPWLPFQMLVAGWIGMTAGWLPRWHDQRRRLIGLAALGALWGFGYGAIMNLWMWPFTAPGLAKDVGLYWSPALSFSETLSHYLSYYLVTSLWYDAFRVVGNVILLLVLGGPVLRTLERYHSRFTWRPWTGFSADGEQSRPSPASPPSR